ncbi:N-acetylglucosamine-6-phosphate deacetylase [Hymenobacter volaticus]|uniref:N-acetylglucosamine-6-phosphate deacetylase n=1 Tax=Hymenobacter volaticus TaxID=2932254 RepID=A0ABY4GFE3_9BACT|nr:N-acetylglucosamine-6-phosphate deacetylase [Hymenobacter volaticus]UOQ69614.1 N-acetylglucosamine-6-phosphate deacetylase [Hymenobacter volaticus]
MTYLLTNCQLYTGDDYLPGHAVLIEGQTIGAVLPPSQLPAGVPQVDARGQFVCPGFVDLQVYGGGGSAFGLTPSSSALAHLRQHTLHHGTTSFLPTVPTTTPAVLAQAVAAVRQALPTMPGLLGLHLEGPFLSAAKRGVHPVAYLVEPTLVSLRAFLHQTQGAVRLLTVAPEVLGSAEQALLRTSGVVLSAGHSNATYEQGMDAFAHGFSVATHLFNGMSAFTSREPGLVGAIYDHPTVPASIVVDGRHCAYASVRISKRLLGERLFLISDATDVGGEGAYAFYRQADHFVDASGTLAGSGLTLLRAVRNCVQHVGLSLAESLRMASLYPARVLGLAHELGRVAPGYRADLCVFDATFTAQATILAGQLQWHREALEPTKPAT